jgi:hypothetical protein
MRPRVLTGWLFLVIGCLSPVLIPFVLATSWPVWIKAGVSSLLALGLPEVCILLAGYLLGRETMDRIWRTLRSALHRWWARMRS